MTKKKALALTLAGAVMFSLATPASAAERSGTKSARVTASDGASHSHARTHSHSRHTHRFSRWNGDAAGASAATGPWYGGPFGFGPGSEAYAQGSWHLNQDGQAYQVPYDCAYPLGYDSGGAAIFDRGCHLP
jgi:hypothetical protein